MNTSAMHCQPRQQVQCKRDGCTVLFTPRTRWQEFCGDKCRNDHHGLERRLKAIRRAGPRLFEALRVIAAAPSENPWRDIAAEAIKDLKAP